MIKTVKNSFILLKDNIVILQPLVLYVLIIGILIKPAMSMHVFNIYSILLLISIFLFTIAFIAGWFYMAKVAISNRNIVYDSLEDKNIASLNLLKQFFTGVGEYFLPMALTIILYVVFFIAFSFIAYKAGLHIIGKPQFDIETIKYFSGMNPEELQKYLAAASVSDKVIISFYNWSLYFSFVSLLFSIITVFWFPIIFYKTKNPFMAYFYNIKFTFYNILDVSIIVIFLTLINLLLSFINIFASLNIVLSVISLLLMFVYMNYYILLVFLYYDEKTQINSHSGT